MVQRMLGAEQSGAARLLFKIDELVSGEGKRLGDVFKDYDASGDGHLSRTEISMALSLLDFRPKFNYDLDGTLTTQAERAELRRPVCTDTATPPQVGGPYL